MKLHYDHVCRGLKNTQKSTEQVRGAGQEWRNGLYHGSGSRRCGAESPQTNITHWRIDNDIGGAAAQRSFVWRRRERFQAVSEHASRSQAAVCCKPAE